MGVWWEGGPESRVFEQDMTEKAFLPRDVWTYGVDRTVESYDLVDGEWEEKERLL